MTPSNAALFVVAVLTAVAAILDLRTGHIPNGLVLLGFVVGSTLHLIATAVLERAAGDPLLFAIGRGAAVVLIGTVVCVVVPLVLFWREAMGGGDVKLLAVVGASLGPFLGMRIQVVAFLLIALYAPFRLAFEGRLLQLLRNTASLMKNAFVPAVRRRTLEPACLHAFRFGPAIFISTILVATVERWAP